MRKEMNGNKNFRNSAHSRLSALEESIKKSAQQQQKLQESIRTQQEDSTTQQEAVANQIQILTTTMQSIHEANSQSQQQAQINMSAMQQLTQTTYSQTQATQNNVTVLTGTINELSQIIRAQMNTPRTTANIIRSERRPLPPPPSTPARGTQHERAIGSASPDKKKACQQTTPQRTTNLGNQAEVPGGQNSRTGVTPVTAYNTPTRTVPPPPPRPQVEQPAQSPPTQSAYLARNPYAPIAGEASEDEEETQNENEPIHFTPEELDVIQLLGAQEADTTDVPTTNEEEQHQYHAETPSSEEHNRELGQEVHSEMPALRGEPDASEETP
jgi:hypothetical protein